MDAAAQGVKMYNREMRQMPLFLFQEVLEHLNQVESALCRPGGNLLLVGRAGVGRRSALNLMAYMLRLNIFTPQVRRPETPSELPQAPQNDFRTS